RPSVPRLSRLPPSISFSGAGFLGVYHAGAADYLIGAGLLQPTLAPGERAAQALLGSSAGALIAASLRLGVRPEQVPAIANPIARRASAEPLRALTPGFSLVDEMEPFLREATGEALRGTLGIAEGEELQPKADEFVRGVDGLQVYLTAPEPRAGLFSYSSHAFLDSFASLEHLLAATVLSSYVPVATGPLSPPPGSAVDRACRLLSSTPMSRHPGGTLPPSPLWYDGGLAAMWPLLDDRTLIVSPLPVAHARNVAICPPPSSPSLPAGGGVSVSLSAGAARSARLMLQPVGEEEYEDIYRGAWEDARRVCREKGIAPAGEDLVR
ncbi:hypothetical protein TeGR_g3669, partial [Tetraparma gracilis]